MGVVSPTSWPNCWKTCAKVPSWEPKHVKSALLGAKTCAKVPSWEPNCAQKCPPGSQNGAKLCMPLHPLSKFCGNRFISFLCNPAEKTNQHIDTGENIASLAEVIKKTMTTRVWFDKWGDKNKQSLWSENWHILKFSPPSPLLFPCGITNNNKRPGYYPRQPTVIIPFWPLTISLTHAVVFKSRQVLLLLLLNHLGKTL